jgi:predicted O-methyltransferase YrrM
MNDVESTCETTLRRIADVHAELGYPREVVALWALPRNDAIDLWRIARDSGARRVLEVGSFVGTSALLMAHAVPEAQIHSVDPNLPLDIEFSAMGAKGDAADLSRRTLEIARLAAHRLGFEDRVHFHEGGFAVGESFALTDAPVPVIGPELCAREGPFDLVYVDGLHFEDAVHADVSLATQALSPQGTIVLHDCIGYWGSHVRRAVARVLESDDSLSFQHAPYGDLLRAIGTLSRRGRALPALEQRAERCFGDVRGLSEHVARLLRATFAHARFESRDALAAAVTAHLGGAPEDAPRVTIAFDALDGVEPAAQDAALRALTEGADAVVLGLTPPGEVDAAGAWSRPLARHVARLSSMGFDCHDLITPFLEPYTHAFGGGSPISRRTSFLLDSIVAVRRGSARPARVADRTPLTAAAARILTDQRLQMLFAARSYADVRGRYQQVHDSAAALRLEADRQHAEAQRLGRLVADWSAWRLHIGRLRLWRRG